MLSLLSLIEMLRDVCLLFKFVPLSCVQSSVCVGSVLLSLPKHGYRGRNGWLSMFLTFYRERK